MKERRSKTDRRKKADRRGGVGRRLNDVETGPDGKERRRRYDRRTGDRRTGADRRNEPEPTDDG